MVKSWTKRGICLLLCILVLAATSCGGGAPGTSLKSLNLQIEEVRQEIIDYQAKGELADMMAMLSSISGRLDKIEGRLSAIEKGLK